VNDAGRFAAAFLMVSASIVGCGGGGAQCPTVRHASAEVLFGNHVAARAHVATLRAEARVEQWGKKGRVRGTVLMMVARPDRVRFDAVTQFGPVLTLTSDGDTFSLTDLENRRFLTGPTCPLNIERLIGIPLEGAEVVRLLFADVPNVAPGTPVECTDEGRYRVVVHSSVGATAYEFDVPAADLGLAPDAQRSRLVRVVHRDASGALLWRATLSDYQSVTVRGAASAPSPAPATKFQMPFDVRIEHPSRHADTQLKFQKVDAGLALPADAFSQNVPPGMVAEQAPCE
jgi:hypothetical protein